MTDPETVLVLNPVSGRANHAARVRELAAEHGFSVRETERSGDAVGFARDAAEDGADRVVACGGDGTLNEVVRGLWLADALPEVEFGVVPGGTGNDFADNIGITSVELAFAAIASGERRTIDLGVVRADGGDPLPFLNSCICGLTANASANTAPEQKERLGVLAYVLSSLREMATFDGLELSVTPRGEGDPWHGPAAMVLVGNARRFPGERATQANVEDGLLDVTIVERQPTVDLASGAALVQLLGRDPEWVTRLVTPHLEIAVRDDDPVTFSLDGEMVTTHRLDVSVAEARLCLPVGGAYDPNPV
ncbi:diacylglycerol/lipid kinase family protein [Halomarina litorea]|uniref:diacylglycerol/lipid kinase family protein n=1 Tax=Halomarina litorea TaxID=2961595 RepID=UPI0020C1ECC9|nr:diacylglycerol kinase family protein [Halomarina sp. BCD28]